MKKSNSAAARAGPAPGASGGRAPPVRRIGVAQAKAELSQEIKNAALSPTLIHNRGRDVAVLLGIEEYERLSALHLGSPMAAFLEDIEELKKRHGGGADFEPPRLAYAPRDPFGSPKERAAKRRSR